MIVHHSIEEIREYALRHLDYDPMTGVFIWKKAPKGHPDVFGKQAGVLRDKYRVIKLFGKAYRAHRLAWLMIYGELPALLDHINRNCDDNRIANLRVTTRLGNARNHSGRSKRSQTPTGVRIQRGKYVARITDRGRLITIGTFNTSEAAASAYQAARKEIFGEHCPS